MSVSMTTAGTAPDGTPVAAFALENRQGMRATLMSWGALLQTLEVPDRNGHRDDVVLGFATLAPYLVRHPNFGVTVGRFGNRIAHARFTLDGVEYQLAANNGVNSLHGGIVNFAKHNWSWHIEGDNAVRFEYVSPDGEEGYPGTLRAAVTYALDDDNGLTLTFAATTDRATVVNLTNHSYFNLAGHGDVRDHQITLHADAFLPVDAVSIPLGEVRAVDGTPMDLRALTSIGDRLDAMDDQMRSVEGGFDHTFVLGAGAALQHAARVVHPGSGRVMDVHTTQPGIQFYTANKLDGTFVGKGGVAYGKYGALCLETQHFPNAPNEATFPSTVLRPGEEYRHQAIYRFSIAS
ncbi:MAG: aldose epimerase family protein [Betaproteobacteria bacterium]